MPVFQRFSSMKKILGVTVIYYPNIELTDNIKSYLDELDCLIIWDNTPDKDNLSLIPRSDKIIRLGENKNVGIGRALNVASDYGITNGFTHLLTMDQDSFFQGNSCRNYIESIVNYDSKAIFSTNYIMNGKKKYDEESGLKKVDLCMTSGSVYPIAILQEIGLFREDFFIDGIDTEICLRAILHNIPTLADTKVKLIHNLGDGVQKSLLGRPYITRNYSKTRLYYIYRNSVVLKRLYGKVKNQAIKQLFNTKLSFHILFIVYIKHIILFEKQKVPKVKAVLKGIIHGCLYKIDKPVY